MMGVNPGSAGNQVLANFNLSGTGYLNMSAGELAVGRGDAACSYTTDTYQQTGGTAVVEYLSIGGISGATSDIATFSVLGGSFSAGSFQSLAAGASSSATINIGGGQVTLPAFPGGVGATSTATLTMNGGTLTTLATNSNYFNGIAYAYAGSNGANFNVPSGQSVTVTQNFQNVAGQAGTLPMLGAGTLVLSGSNSYSGGTTINQGTLQLGSGTATLGSSSGSLGIYGGVLDIHGAYNPTVGQVTLSSGAIGVNGTSGTLTGSNFTLQSGNVYASLGGAAALNKTTAGIVVLHTADGYSGGTTVAAGVLSTLAAMRWARADWPWAAARSTWKAIPRPSPA